MVRTPLNSALYLLVNFARLSSPIEILPAFFAVLELGTVAATDPDSLHN
jgi:hypothetical protein